MNYFYREEIDVNQTDSKEPIPVNKITSTTTTTTTSTTPASAGWDDNDLEKPVPPIVVDDNDIDDENTDFSRFKPRREDHLPLENTPIQPDNSKPIKPKVSMQPEITPVSFRHPEEVRPLQPIQPEILNPIRPETSRQPEKVKPIEPGIPREPENVKPIIRPMQPEQPKYEPQHPEYEPKQPEARAIEPKPTDEYILQPDNNHVEKSEPSPTPPQVVFIDVGKETATIDGKKMDDGSVVVDTHDVPKNEWTTIKEKPSVRCPPGFEANDGVCLGM